MYYIFSALIVFSEHLLDEGEPASTAFCAFPKSANRGIELRTYAAKLRTSLYFPPIFERMR